MSERLVSIVIPTFNNSEVIGQTIESLQAQKYSKWEALFVDDGSSDNTIDIIDNYQLHDNRIIIIKREELPKGGSHCRNIGIENAKGDYLILLDGDDILAPDCIQKRVEAMNNSNYDFIVNQMVTFKDDVILGKNVGDKTIKKPLYAFAGGHAVWQITQPIYRMEFVRKLGGLDVTFQRMQDIEFELRAIVESKGNYQLKLSDSNVDCYYRVSNKEVTAAKYTVTLKQYDKFAHLVYRIREQGLLRNDSIFRKSLLCLILGSYIVGLTPKLQNKCFPIELNKTFSISKIYSDLHYLEKALLGIVNIFKRWPLLQYRLSWFIRRTIMYIYM